MNQKVKELERLEEAKLSTNELQVQITSLKKEYHSSE